MKRMFWLQFLVTSTRLISSLQTWNVMDFIWKVCRLDFPSRCKMSAGASFTSHRNIPSNSCQNENTTHLKQRATLTWAQRLMLRLRSQSYQEQYSKCTQNKRERKKTVETRNAYQIDEKIIDSPCIIVTQTRWIVGFGLITVSPFTVRSPILFFFSHWLVLLLWMLFCFK